MQNQFTQIEPVNLPARFAIIAAAAIAAPQALAITNNNAGAYTAKQTASSTPMQGMLVIRNGSGFATLSVTIYRLEGGGRSAVKNGTAPPDTSLIYSLPVGDYLAVFAVDNGTAAISEDRFSIEAQSGYTINFHTGKP